VKRWGEEIRKRACSIFVIYLSVDSNPDNADDCPDETLDDKGNKTLQFVTASMEDGITLGRLLVHYIDPAEDDSDATNTSKDSLPPEVQIDVRLPHETVGTNYTVKSSDTIAVICSSIAAYLKWETDGRYGLRLETSPKFEFLSPETRLDQLGQEIVLGGTLVFGTRLFVPSQPLSQQEDYIRFLMGECVSCVVGGDWAVTKEQATKLAAFQLQHEEGDYNPKTHNDRFFNDDNTLASILPNSFRKQSMVADVIREYKTLKGNSKNVAGFGYVNYVRKIPTYGEAFFYVQIEDVSELLIVSPQRIGKADPQTHRVLEEWRYPQLKSLTFKGEILTFEFENSTITCGGADMALLKQLVLDYFNLKKDTTCSVM